MLLKMFFFESCRRVSVPYFFENTDGQAVTVNGDRYCPMMAPKINNNLDDIWFQQDGHTPHFANDTIDFWSQKFPGLIISRDDYFNIPYDYEISHCWIIFFEVT